LAQDELRVFKTGRYAEAIGIWEKLDWPDKHAALTAAIAEAHFRLTVGNGSGADALPRLEQATGLAPAPGISPQGLQTLAPAMRFLPGQPREAQPSPAPAERTASPARPAARGTASIAIERAGAERLKLGDYFRYDFDRIATPSRTKGALSRAQERLRPDSAFER
jgi:hypothetical protein